MLDRAEIGWWAEAAPLRRLARQQVPNLISPESPAARAPRARPSWPGSAAPSCRGTGGASAARTGGDTAELSLRLRRAAESLGPTFIKLGQIISSGEGLFPPELVDEFKRCRDQVPAEPFDVVRATVEADLGRPLDDVFATFDVVPLAAASIAQVHAARLRTGEDVVVKVQRPDVARLVHHDLRAMAWLAPHLVGRIPVAALANPPALVELFADTIVEELDFRVEAANMLDVAGDAARARPDRLRGAATSSGAGHPPRARDATPRRVQVRRRERDARGRRRHRGGRAHGDDRPDGRGDDQRHLPRRPARGQPARARRRAHRVARLRHRRAPRRRTPGRLPAADGGGDDQRPEGADGGTARPRRAARRHGPAGRDPRPRTSTRRRSTRRR